MPILPEKLILKIWNYKDNGYKNKDIVDLVEDEAEPHVSSKQQLVRCVGSIAGKHTMGQKPRRTTVRRNSIMVESRIPDSFNYPKTFSNEWNKDAFEAVSYWIIKELNMRDIGAPQDVGQLAFDSRDWYIKKRGNIDPVRYILSLLHRKGYVEIKDNSTFYIKKRITFLSLFKNC